MDITQQAGGQGSMTVDNLRDRLKNVDGTLLVIFEHVVNGDVMMNHSIDAVQKTGGFFLLVSMDG